ncbi:MAG: hypothetical protein ABTQ25_02075 [Nitrosomonas ureae]
METKNNIIDMQAWREKKAAEKANHEIKARAANVPDATDAEMEKFIDESIRGAAEDGVNIQMAGDSLYLSGLAGVVQDGIAYDSGRILLGMKKLGWVPTLPKLSPYDRIILGEFVHLRKSGLDIGATLEGLATSTKLKCMGITERNISESLKLVVDYFELFGGRYAE